MPLYSICLQDKKTEKITNTVIGSACLSEAEEDANQSAKLQDKIVVSVARANALSVEENWGEHTARKF